MKFGSQVTRPQETRNRIEDVAQKAMDLQELSGEKTSVFTETMEITFGGSPAYLFNIVTIGENETHIISTLQGRLYFSKWFCNEELR